MIRYTVFFNGEQVKVFELEEPVVFIGRLPENHIPISNMGISRRHVKIELDPQGSYTLTDLNSLNGTLVNGKKVKKVTLASGDKIAIGKYVIVYEDLRGESAANMETIVAEFRPEELQRMAQAAGLKMPPSRTPLQPPAGAPAGAPIQMPMPPRAPAGHPMPPPPMHAAPPPPPMPAPAPTPPPMRMPTPPAPPPPMPPQTFAPVSAPAAAPVNIPVFAPPEAHAAPPQTFAPAPQHAPAIPPQAAPPAAQPQGGAPAFAQVSTPPFGVEVPVQPPAAQPQGGVPAFAPVSTPLFGVEAPVQPGDDAQGGAVLIETTSHIVYRLDRGYLTIGADEEDDIYAAGFMVNKAFAAIEQRDGGFYISAQKVMSKFKVNGKSVKSHRLEHRDRIEIGSNTFRFMENG